LPHTPGFLVDFFGEAEKINKKKTSLWGLATPCPVLSSGKPLSSMYMGGVTITRANAITNHRRTRQTMKIYTIALEKGGTGKSSVAVNLAAAFTQLHYRTLLIDLDAQAHATRWLGKDPHTILPETSILGIIRGHAPHECTIQTDENITVIPAHPEMAGLPIALASAPNNGLFILRTALAQLAQSALYDIVICDLPPARSPILATALVAATRCIAPVQPEDLVLHALADLTTSVRHAQQINPALPDITILRNRYAPRSAVDNVYHDILQTRYKTQLLTTIIPSRAAIRESAAFGQTIFRYTGSDVSHVRKLFSQLANEILDRDINNQ
jgi:chromosome partitioning protein